VAEPWKIPRSVLVVIHTPAAGVLLMERADRPGFWQSVTGAQEFGESLRSTAVRELAEETGLVVRPEQLVDWKVRNVYAIFPYFRHRYAPGTTHNTEHLFSLCLSTATPVRLAPREHTAQVWLPWQEAMLRATSWTNRNAIRDLARRLT
jgi:dATP pyrophosphohydrolase